ncbi:hypothetical protein ACKKBG_A32820 [Auxenochlorella protothecoides x Auxenochlorella symbiontica]|uniref:Thiosulfate sulfurtransferase 16, chloroplastic n=2 Tax=Auxenochlorella protothecoides TaxID=3075 RepID=A0A087SBA8_AUXPR|nr:Thiosulfate sulfurtransferase 16, chloroplastic [Auxenochlorella protothecoides]KFM23012.1 Thiosulfate sulfurtransferase 16, chloroplastic [Auxenochlorella protothecoides]RMZ57415.1 hypothetical protein APUTEX25_004249 [Auxenochlorella protothecoides]|eukprot:RMZ57415.1 hypothetical protein APUTEX25_004249 [Auxenochlorella protothecoides]
MSFTSLQSVGNIGGAQGTLLPRSFSRALPSPRRTSRVEAASASQASTDEAMGFRYDASMQRWVKDARYTGAKYNTLITPKSGTPYTIWPVMHTELVRRKVRCVEPEEAHNAVSSGKAVLLDVRLPKQFEKGHADGAVNIPLYRITAGNKLWDKIKRIVMGGMVMDATERDPDFSDKVVAALGRNAHRTRVIVVCGVGGTLETAVTVASTGKVAHNDPDRAFGRESRALKACYELLKAKFSKVEFLKGGHGSWRHGGFPMDYGHADEE